MNTKIDWDAARAEALEAFGEVATLLPSKGLRALADAIRAPWDDWAPALSATDPNKCNAGLCRGWTVRAKIPLAGSPQEKAPSWDELEPRCACAIGFAMWRGHNLRNCFGVQTEFNRLAQRFGMKLSRFTLWFDSGMQEADIPFVVEAIEKELKSRGLASGQEG